MEGRRNSDSIASRLFLTVYAPWMVSTCSFELGKSANALFNLTSPTRATANSHDTTRPLAPMHLSSLPEA